MEENEEKLSLVKIDLSFPNWFIDCTFTTINIYQNICLPFPVSLFKNYFANRINYEQINKKIIRIESDFEDTYVQLNYSCIIIKSNCNFPQILKIFNIYNKNIFICDFKHKDFFWLNEPLKKTTLKI